MNTRKLITLALIASMLSVLPAPHARADTGQAIFSLLKKYHPDKDGVEFARYYVYNPEHGDVIYSKVAAQDYVFIGILVAAKAAKNQKILPGGKPFDYNACTTPINTFNAVFATSGEFIEKYGQEEHVKGYLQSGNDEGKKEAETQLAEYVPYWKEIPSICHFTFFTEFEDEQHIRETLSGSWKLIRGGVEDFSSGNVASGVAKLAQTGVTAETACMLADNAISGGMIGNTPVLGSLAKSACAGFAGAVIKGINTAVGAVVNGVGEFIGDFACAAGIGSCTGNASVNGIYNKNFETLVHNWVIAEEPATAEAWAHHWYTTIQANLCVNQTGDPGGCEAAYQQITADARERAKLLRDQEVTLAYETIYKPKVREVAFAPNQSQLLKELDQLCADNLLAKYPWPGLQIYGAEQHNEDFRYTCKEAQRRLSLGGGKSFNTQVNETKSQLTKVFNLAKCGQAGSHFMKRSCGSYPGQTDCVNGLGKFGIDRGTAETEYCKLNVLNANISLANAVAEEATCESQTSHDSPKFVTRCATYTDQRLCVQTLNAMGVPPELRAGCRVDKALANKDVMDRMLISLALGSDLGPTGCKANKVDGNPAFTCANTASMKDCKTARAKQQDPPASVGRCFQEIAGTMPTTIIPGGTTAKTIPIGGTTTILPGTQTINPGGKSGGTKVITGGGGAVKIIPTGGSTKTIPVNPGTKTIPMGTKAITSNGTRTTTATASGRPVAVTTTQAAQRTAPTREQILGSLGRRGCTEEADVRMSFTCNAEIGFNACEMYRAKKQVRACRLVAGQ